MRTVRCSSRLWRGVCPGGCVCPGEGVCLPRGVSTQGVSAQGGCLAPPPPLWTEWQMLVRILPCRNYVADVKNVVETLTFDANSLLQIRHKNVTLSCMDSLCSAKDEEWRNFLPQVQQLNGRSLLWIRAWTSSDLWKVDNIAWQLAQMEMRYIM